MHHIGLTKVSLHLPQSQDGGFFKKNKLRNLFSCVCSILTVPVMSF